MKFIRGTLSNSAIIMLLSGLVLSCVGVLLVYSATHSADSGYDRGLYLKQALWVFVSMFVFVLVLNIPLRLHEALSYIYYTIFITLLIALMFYGRIGGGSQRWFNLGFFHFQPSELGKIIIVFVLARYLSYSKKPAQYLKKLMVTLGLILLPAVLVLKQPDLGTSLVYLVSMAVLLFWSGLPAVYLLLIISPVFGMAASFHPISWILFFAVVIGILYLLRPGAWWTSAIVGINLFFGMITPIIWNRLADYQKLRVKIFLNPGLDPLGAGYQIIQSKIAIGSGGLLGKGFLAGSQTNLNYLPVRHTDFIFSVMGEEFGFIGGMIIIALMALIIFLGLRTAMRVRNRTISFICIGATTILFFQAIVNIGMTVGLMPVTGLPLHFVSYGGSSMILSWILLGLIVNAELNWQEY